jgi:S1-C subfamily serine protease
MSTSPDVLTPRDVDTMTDMTEMPPGPPFPPPAPPGPPPGPPAPPGPPMAPPVPPTPEPPGRLRHLLTGALVGGLCGALVATGAFLVFDDDDGTTTATPVRTPELSRESSTIGTEGDVASIVAAVEPAVVAVTTEIGPSDGGGQAAGTGFVIGSDGVIVTNNHVVADADEIEVAFSDGRTMPAEIVGRDAAADLAVVKIDATGLPVVQLGDSDSVQVGDDVVAIGNALALEGGLTVTRGIISGPPREVVAEEIGIVLESVLQTDAAINRGNSGGPIVDARGRVIGINTAIAGNSAENVGFAIPISIALPIIEDLRAGRLPAFLGVATDSLTPALAEELDLEPGDGAVVVNVTEGSPADSAGLETNDVIVEIAGDPVKEAGDVPDAIRRHRPGDEIDVVFRRGDERMTVQATLVERPDSE